MKKKFINSNFENKIRDRIKNTMKSCSLILLISICYSFSDSYSQSKKFNIEFKEASLRQIISEIENQSEFVIIYDDDVWELLNKKVKNVDVKNKNIEDVLNRVLSPDLFNYSINDRQVVISKNNSEERAIVKVVQNEIKGTITDESGIPLPGVNVIVVGTQRGTQTDFDGNYTLRINKGEIVEFSFVGMKSKRVTIGDNNTINITLEEDAAGLDEVVVVAFGEQKKESVIASITTIKPSELKIPSSNLTTALAGRVSGLISYQRSGEPGADNAEFFVRGISTFGQGASPLILLDGFEISANELSRVQPDDIASFSVMKDATATSLYGARGANGVILITTKEGKEGKAQISFRHETSFSRPTQTPQVVGGVEYMELYNQAQFNDDPLLPKFYSVQRIENTKNGLNPYAFPDVNWYDELFKTQAVNSRYNINVTGGGKVATYYLAGSYTRDNGLLKVDKKNNFNSNIQINNYNLRSNLNIKLSPKTTVGLKISSDFNRSNTPTSSGTAIYNSVMAINPVEFPKFYEPDAANEFTKHILFGNSSTATTENLFTNPYAESVKGFKDYFSATVLSQLSIKTEITENLTFSGNFTIQSFGEFSSSRSYDPFYYRYKDYDQITDSYTLEQINDNGSAALSNPSVSRNSNSRNYFESRLLYNKTFDEKHAVTGLLVGRAEEKMNQSAGSGIYATLPSRNNGISGRLTYGYDSRYLFEANFGYNGSEKFSEKERYGFFPAIGFGYLMSNEKYWKGIEDVVNTMKLKFTYGLVGNDAIASDANRFFFLSQISNSGNGYTWGTNYQTNYSGYTVQRYANNLITWEVAEKLNIGVEMKILNAINLNVDYFKENRSDIYLSRDFIPNSVGLSAAIYGNVGEATSQGIDGSLDFNHSFTPDLWLSGRSTFTFAKSKIIEDEKQYIYDYQDRKGSSISQSWGLVAERLFVDQAEIDNSPVQEFGPYQAGDIKYKDINGDGLVNSNDAVAIGDPTSPEIIYGFGLSGGYKAFDLSFFFQGSAKSSFFIDSQKVAPFVGRRNALEIVADDYWNLNNPNPEAFWPRLSTTVVDNNTQQSTWWLRDGDFLRLKSLEVGYTIPQKTLTKFHLQKFRVYASATNLLTISKFDLWDIEMGGNGLGYPVQRVINVGLQVSL